MGNNERFTLCFNLFSFDKQTTPNVLWLSLLKGLRYGRNEKIHVQFLLERIYRTGSKGSLTGEVEFQRFFLKKLGLDSLLLMKMVRPS
jgi:hypothetical protein